MSTAQFARSIQCNDAGAEAPVGRQIVVYCGSRGTFRMFRRRLAVFGATALLVVGSAGHQVTGLAHASSSSDATAYAAPVVPGLRGSVVTTYAGGSSVVEHPLYASTLGLSTSYNVFLPAG